MSYDLISKAESAGGFPGARKVYLTTKNEFDAEGGYSNHEQIKNDKNTKVGLDYLYYGYHGSYFKTDPR